MNTVTLTPAEAKAKTQDFLAEAEASYRSLSAKTVDFTDLARSSVIVVTIKGWTPDPLAADLRAFAKAEGFQIAFA